MASSQREKTRLKIFLSFIGALLKIVSEIAAVIVSLVACILGFLNIWTAQLLLSAFFAIFAFIIIHFVLQDRNIQRLSQESSETFSNLQTLVDNRINPSCDSVLFEKNESKETKIINNATHQLFLLQETGNLIIERNKISLLHYLNNGGTLKVIVCCSDLFSTQMLALRNSDLVNPDDFVNRKEAFMSQLRSIYNSARKPTDVKKRLEVRNVPYPIDITAVISDDEYYKEGVVRFAGFKSTYSEKIDISFNASVDYRTYNYYYSQVQKYYRYSYKKILITGVPHTGKTTLIKQLINAVEAQNLQDYVYYVYSEEIIEDNKRIGYQYVSSITTTPQIFAIKEPTDPGSQYEVDCSAVDKLAQEITNNSSKILIVDEVGILQFSSAAFSQAILNIVGSQDTTLIGSITQNTDNRMLNLIKESVFVNILLFKREDRDRLFAELKDELFASINMYSILKRRDNGD